MMESGVYLARRHHLAELAEVLHSRGWLTRILDATGVEAPALPALRVSCPLDPYLDSADVVTAVGHGNVDWYRWHGGGFISPVAEVEVAAVEVVRSLLPLRWIR